jgi:hypothetical protein
MLKGEGETTFLIGFKLSDAVSLRQVRRKIRNTSTGEALL